MSLSFLRALLQTLKWIHKNTFLKTHLCPLSSRKLFFRAFCLGIRFENIILAVLRKIKMHLSFEIPDINFRSLLYSKQEKTNLCCECKSKFSDRRGPSSGAELLGWLACVCVTLNMLINFWNSRKTIFFVNKGVRPQIRDWYFTMTFHDFW